DALGYTEAGMTAFSDSIADLRITLRDGTSFTVGLDGAQSIGDVLQIMKLSAPGGALVDFGIDDHNERITIKDLSTPASGGVFKIENLNGSTIGDELGITGTASAATPGEIDSIKLVDAYSVRDITSTPVLHTSGVVTFDIGFDSRLIIPAINLSQT